MKAAPQVRLSGSDVEYKVHDVSVSAVKGILEASHLKKSSAAVVPMNGMERWVWGSIPPGIT
jgi:hypothetical protein